MGLDPRALDALENNQRQLDQDGVEVGVSRQALDELISAYKLATGAEPDKLPTWVPTPSTVPEALLRAYIVAVYGPDAFDLTTRRMMEDVVAGRCTPPLPLRHHLEKQGLEHKSQERRAPVQGLTGGIPWSMHLRAYDVYRKKYGDQRALIEGDCRGGFGTGELDMFIPSWRDELSEMVALRERVQELTESRNLLDEIALVLETAGYVHMCNPAGIRSLIAEIERPDPLTVVAEALECFWNASIGSARNSEDATALAIAGALSEGFAAIAARLKEKD